VPLLIDLKNGDKIIINGAVLENSGNNTKLLVHNKVPILREKEVLSEDDARTPASRVYFALQCAYIFPSERADYLKAFRGFVDDYAAAAPTAEAITNQIKAFVEKEELYRALKAAQKLIKHESDIFSEMHRVAEAVVSGKEA
jgi:flagellar protein FlbT